MGRADPEFTFCEHCKRSHICGDINECRRPCVTCGESGLAKNMTWC